MEEKKLIGENMDFLLWGYICNVEIFQFVERWTLQLGVLHFLSNDVFLIINIFF